MRASIASLLSLLRLLVAHSIATPLPQDISSLGSRQVDIGDYEGKYETDGRSGYNKRDVEEEGDWDPKLRQKAGDWDPKLRQKAGDWDPKLRQKAP